MAKEISSFLHDERTEASVRALFERMETLTAPAHDAPAGRWQGKRFVVTGTLESMPRSRVKEIVEAARGRITSAVSEETDFLIEGDKAGKKASMARALGVAVWTEEAFLRAAGLEELIPAG